MQTPEPEWRDPSGRIYCILDLEPWLRAAMSDSDDGSDNESENAAFLAGLAKSKRNSSLAMCSNVARGRSSTSVLADTRASHPYSKAISTHAGLERRLYECELGVISDEISLSCVIGRGRAAVVWKGHFKHCETYPLAIKPISGMCDDRMVLTLLSDIVALRSSPHPNIVHTWGITLGGLPMQIVTEFCAGGSCYDLIYSSSSLSDMQVRKMCVDVVNAMSHLHALSPKILHRNLTSRNVLLAQPITLSTAIPHAKVSDYNLESFLFDCGAECNGSASMWIAPEVVGGCFYSEKADVYAFAGLLYELLHFQVQIQDAHATELFSRIEAIAEVQPNMYTGKELLLQIMRSSCAADPSQRPSFVSIQNTLLQSASP